MSAEIDRKCAKLSEAGFNLGRVTQSERVCQDGIGRYIIYEAGAIYWSPSTGAHVVRSNILIAYFNDNAEIGNLKYPTSEDCPTPDGLGHYQVFQGGQIYWPPDLEAWPIHYGPIWEKWSNLNFEQGFLGYPIEGGYIDVTGKGSYQDFQNGSIYYSPHTGAHEIHGPIYQEWVRLDGTRGKLGFPTTDEMRSGTGRHQEFQGGTIECDLSGRNFRIFPRRRGEQPPSARRRRADDIRNELGSIRGRE